MTFLCKFMRTYFRASALHFEFQQRLAYLRSTIYYILQLEYHVTFSICRYIWGHVHISIEDMKSWHHEFHFSKTLSVHDDVRKKCFRRNLKPHCIHICKVNITILCVIRYQKFTGVKLCLKYFNGNRNELQNLNRNMMKIIHVYVHRE